MRSAGPRGANTTARPSVFPHGLRKVVTGAQILSAVLRAFDFSAQSYTAAHRNVAGRSGRRFRRGEDRVRASCEQVASAAAMLFGVPDCRCRTPHKLPVSTEPLVSRLPKDIEPGFLGFALHAHIIVWDDRVRERVRSDPSLLRALLRFAAVHVGLKAGWISAAQAGRGRALTRTWLEDPKEALIAVLKQMQQRRQLPTQAAVAGEIGVSEETLRLWKRGQVRPSEESLLAIADAADARDEIARVRRLYGCSALLAALRDVFGEQEIGHAVDVVNGIARCKAAIAIRPGYATFASYFAIPFSGWMVPDEVVVREAAAHGAAEWAKDLRQAGRVWRGERALADAASLDFVRELDVLHCTATADAEPAQARKPRRAAAEPASSSRVQRAGPRNVTSGARGPGRS